MAYAGHEMESVKIARDFLIGNGLDAERIEKICLCVLATIFPQNPKSRMEMVLCDADFFHFSRTDYAGFESSLRIEWETILNRYYTNEQWNSINLAMLINHHYFTDFGRTVLQEKNSAIFFASNGYWPAVIKVYKKAGSRIDAVDKMD